LFMVIPSIVAIPSIVVIPLVMVIPSVMVSPMGEGLGPEPGQANRKERIGRWIRRQRTNPGIGVIWLLECLS
jgi:hypothetical protein